MCDFDDEFDDFEDDGFMDDEPFDNITSDQDEAMGEAEETDTDDYSGPGWQTIAFLGAWSEEKQRRERIRRELLGKDYLKSDFD